jgi:hypothetical protein
MSDNDMSDNTRAVVGGELGINGDWYKGGQFLPSTPEYPKGYFKNARAKNNAMKIRKEEVSNRVWETMPAHNVRSLWGMIKLFVNTDGDVVASDQTLEYMNVNISTLTKYVNMFKNGVKYIECEVNNSGGVVYPSLS